MSNRATEPFAAMVRKIVDRDGQAVVSFDGMNSLYPVPPHLDAVIRKAAADRLPLEITTNGGALVTAELASTPRAGAAAASSH